MSDNNGGGLPRATLDAILDVDDLRREVVDVPEWGMSVALRGLTLREREDAMTRSTVNGDLDGAAYGLRCLIAGMEEPELSEDHLGVLGRRAFKVIDRLVGRVWVLSGMVPDDDVPDGVQEVARREAVFPAGPAAGGDHADGEGPRPDQE